ncbi:unnamed protein product [Cuscuta campestris]|uniref:Uncharacterized protein n=1 Tax=Cuscuta campestris TaxID=132261 RepID=A0A484LTR0_9ASTE|nr:unnamed protein product [Cuscuta campestris]
MSFLFQVLGLGNSLLVKTFHGITPKMELLLCLVQWISTYTALRGGNNVAGWGRSLQKKASHSMCILFGFWWLVGGSLFGCLLWNLSCIVVL